MKKILTLLTALALALCAVAKDKKPNFLVIVADDMGYSDLGCYGGEIQTPVLDKLAAEGVRFTDFYNTARCWTSRSALMCGYYHTQLGVEGGGKKGTPWTRSIAQMLKPLGYRSYHSGKWHVPPINKIVAQGGFDRSFCVNDHNHHFKPKNNTLDDVKLPAISKDGEYYSSTTTTDYMIDFLKEHKEKSADRPFFAYLAYIAPHFPLQAPQSDIDKYRGKYDAGWEKARLNRFEKQKKLGLPDWNLSATERQITIPYGKAENFRRQGSLLSSRMEQPHARAEKIPVAENGNSRRNGRPHGL